ncbi:3-oxosteroid 1-dehydrogenase [Acrocarpospora pleiomorpha]|uniref:3-oxosteroid 1-dehydrogenase n=1 Tax=Acrocarpospora pleiomorpha TaxID=90975 RepID=A0A5M3XHD3_9ACTN|nr:3-oxosteroid 1-dehydrogenase [Acrocarpospora pleiomorpha]
MAVGSPAESFDLVIVGSGGGGLTAALAAAEAGLKPVILEKREVVGGSTSMSGGVVWMPNNPLMRAAGVPDSYEAGLTYLQSVVGDPDDASSMERRKAFLAQGPAMISFIQRKGVKLTRCEGYSDYYDNRKGGHARGRSIEGIPWDGRQLGEWHSKINPGMGRSLDLAVMTNEVRNLPAAFRSARSFRAAARVVLRTKISRLLGKDLLTNGMSLVGQLTKACVDTGIPIWLNTDVRELVVSEGRVVGVRAERDGVPTVVTGTGGVLLAAGGFERNGEMRLSYNADTQPNDGERTMGNPGNTGTVLQAAIALGAKVDYMDEAVWNPAPRREIAISNLTTARQFPHTIFVNKSGRRFVNESNSYIEVVKAMYANDAVPAWLIFDDAFRRKYPWGRGMPKIRNLASVLPGRLPEEWVSQGWIKRADTVEELARLIGVDPRTLATTVANFNEYATRGQDPEFNRGVSQYNKALGDPGNKPNPAVGTLAEPPFYATEIFAADVGTIGGVITNQYAQVLDQQLEPIAGLYAAGNMAATVVGRTYPGAGASIAHTMTFGYIAAHHVADLRTQVPAS